jgi:osmotically-inducible protein OsmY
MLEQGGFEWTPERQTVVNDLALASRVRAELAVNPFTSNLEVDVKASGGAVSVRGDFFEQSEAVQRVALAVAGVTGLTVEELATADPA